MGDKATRTPQLGPRFCQRTTGLSMGNDPLPHHSPTHDARPLGSCTKQQLRLVAKSSKRPSGGVDDQ